MRDGRTLQEVARMIGLDDQGEQTVQPHLAFSLLKDEALKKLVRVEHSLTRLLFRTSTELDPLKIEYDRGFRQGVMYALEGLPNEIASEWKRYLKEGDQA